MSQFPANTAIGTFYTEIAHKYELTENGIFYLDLRPFGLSQMVLHDKVQDYLTPLLGDEAIGASDGEKWKVLHHMLATAFRPAKMKSMASVIAELVRELLRPALETHADIGEVFSMENCAAQLVFAISSRVILSDGVSKAQNARLLADMNQIVEYATTATNPLVKSFVQERMAQIVRNKMDKGTSSTILDTILVNAQSTQCDPCNPASLTPEFVRIYVFIMLAMYPSVVFGSDPKIKMGILKSTPHKLNELHYTTAVIKETLRLLPVGFNARKENLGLLYPTRNEMIIPTIHIIHYDASVFPHPTKFDPSRFVATEDTKFECAGVEVENRPETARGQRAQHTDLDLLMGDLAFQEMEFSAKATGGTMMKVKKHSALGS
ncbi:cytochrome P450 [Aspergillus insuetus]